MTCKQLFRIGPDRINLVLAWLQANDQGANDPPHIDLDKLNADKANADKAKLAGSCAKNPNEQVIEAADELFDK